MPSTQDLIQQNQKPTQLPLGNTGTTLPPQNPSKPDVQASDLNTNFQPNILNNFETYSYYFNLFMLPIDQLNVTDAAAVLADSTPKIILAETGATGLNIKEVNILAQVGPNFRGMNATGARVTIDLVEPAGLSLYDKIYFAARQLGLPNYTKSPIFLGLKFKGYDQSGNLSDPIGPNVWLWPLQIYSMVSNFKDGFGYYTIEAVVYNEIGESDVVSRTKNHFSTDASNLQGFFNDFSKFLDQSEYEYRLAALGLTQTEAAQFSATIPANQYQIQLHAETWGSSFTPDKQTIRVASGDDPNLHPSRAGTVAQFQNGETIVSFSKNTNIRDVIDLIMSSNPFIQDLANRSKNPDSGDGADPQNIYSQIWRVEIETKINVSDPSSYDWVFNDFTRTYIYHIYNYKSRRPVLVPEAGANPNSAGSPNDQLVNKVNQTTAITDLQNRNFLVKRYDYLYTGLNTEILNLDLKMEYMWAAVQPIYEGTRDYATNTTTAIFNDIAKERGTAQKLIDSLKTTAPQYNQLLKQYEDLKLQISQEPSNNKIQFAFQATSAQLAALTAQRNSQISQLQSIETTGQRTVQQNPRLFLQSNLTKQQYAEEMNTTFIDTPPVPLTLAPESASSEFKTTWSVEDTWQKGKSLLASTLNQLNGPNRNLMEIDLEIRGDPYWFGRTIVDSDYYNPPQFTPPKNQAVPYYNLGEHGFVLIFRFPQGYDADGNPSFTTSVTTVSGNILNLPSDVINCIYYVMTANHKFIDGRFIQVLHAIRDPNTNIKGILF